MGGNSLIKMKLCRNCHTLCRKRWPGVGAILYTWCKRQGKYLAGEIGLRQESLEESGKRVKIARQVVLGTRHCRHCARCRSTIGGNVKRIGRIEVLAGILAAVLLSMPGCMRQQPAQKDSAGASQGSPSRQTIVFMTDFGTANDSVAICRAVMTGIAPDARIMDITHQVTPFSIEEGARFLAAVSPYYPSGTVFLVVVDPGVGTSRKAVIVKSKKGQFFVLPDNGLITPVLDRDGLEAAREITNHAWMVGENVSSTFHGRDIFSPAAAHLAPGEDWTC